MMTWLRRRLHRWLETGEDRVLAPLAGQVPASDAMLSEKLAYWQDVKAAAGSPQGKLLLHRVQIMYNLSQLDLLRTNPSDTAKLAKQAAQMQALWEVMVLESTASKKCLAYTSNVQALLDEDSQEE